MRLRNVKGSREAIESSTFSYNEDDSEALYKVKGKWNQEFGLGEDRPLHIEIGMGKGTFITTLAELHPDINYIGIEKFSSVLIRAIEKKDELAEAGKALPNLKFIRMDAENIEQVFDKGEVDKIYLNFSDPWPKERHAKRRLTSTRFLGRYLNIIKDNAPVEFKTDNRDLFDFSLEEVKEAKWSLDLVTFDLHHSDYLEGNIMTEYEKRFVSEGKPICKMVTHFQK